MRFARLVLLLGIGFAIVPTVGADALAQKTQPQSSRAGIVESEFRGWLNSFDKSGARTSNGGITYDETSEEIAVKDLKITWSSGKSSGAELRIGRLAIKAFKAETQGIRFERAIADNLQVGSNDAVPSWLRTQRVEVGNGSLPNLATFVADPAKPISGQIGFLRLLTQAQVTKVNAGKIQIGESLSIARIAMSEISAGKISLGEIEDLGTALAGGTGPNPATSTKARLSVAAATVSNLNIEPYIRLFEPSAYLDAGSARPWSDLVGAIALRDVKFSDGAATLSVANGKVGALRVRQFAENLTEIFDRSSVDPGYLSQNPEIAARVAAAVRDAFAVESAFWEGLEVSTPTQAGELTATVKDLALTNLTSSRIDQFRLEALSIADPSGKLSLGNLDVSGLSFAALHSNASATSSPTMVPTVSSVVAQRIVLDTQQVDLTLDKLDVAMSYFIGATPTNIKAKLDSLKFVTDQVGVQPLRQALMDFGYKDVDLSLNVSGAWEDASSSFSFDSIELTGKDMGTLSFSGAITGITRAAMEAPQSHLWQELIAGGVRNLRISFENASLVDRLIQVAAKQNGKSVDEIKKILSSNMPAIMGGISSPDIRNKFIFAAISFINDPQVLSVATRNSEPSMINEILNALGEPSKLPTVLKLDASANARKR